MRRLVVVGAALAGLRAAQAARAAGFDGELVVVGDEERPPYTRPPLSKELLAGTQTPEQCALPHGALEVAWRRARPHEERGVTSRCELCIAALHGPEHVEAVELTDGDRLDADVVLMALGALPNVESLAGSGLALHPELACDATLTTLHDPD